MSRGTGRRPWQSAALATVTLCLTTAAAAQPRGASVRVEAAAGTMLASYQRTSLDFGLLMAGGVRLGYAPVQPLVVQLGYVAWYGPSDSGDGSQHTFEAGVRVEVPIAGRLRPWIDGNVGYARTGALGRLAVSAALGAEIDLARWLSVGPYVRYGQTVATSADHPSDARMLVGGLSLTARVPRRAVAVATHAPVVGDSDGDGVYDDDDVCPHAHAGETPDSRRPGCPGVDSDGDGVPDHEDVCSDVAAGPHPEMVRPGCPAPDSDEDGILDRDDACRTTPVGAHPDPYRLGCPDGDDDGDGMLNAIDRCPLRHQGLNPDPVNPGCPRPDRDQDSVPDASDRCINTAGGPSRSPERNGCPGLVRIEGNELHTSSVLEFAPGTERLLPRSVPVLAAVADVLRASPWIRKVSIDVRPGGASAQTQDGGLALRRATSVRAWLVGHGVERTRLEAHGVDAPAPAAVAAPGGEGSVRFRIVERAGDPPPGGLHGQ